MRFWVIALALLCGMGSPLWAAENCDCAKGCVCSNQTEQVWLEGKLTTAGPSIYMEGSHELQDGAGKVLARLSGLQSELDLSSHEGQWVKVGGAWRPTVEAGGKILEVTSLTVSPSP